MFAAVLDRAAAAGGRGWRRVQALVTGTELLGTTRTEWRAREASALPAACAARELASAMHKRRARSAPRRPNVCRSIAKSIGMPAWLAGCGGVAAPAWRGGERGFD